MIAYQIDSRPEEKNGDHGRDDIGVDPCMSSFRICFLATGIKAARDWGSYFRNGTGCDEHPRKVTSSSLTPTSRWLTEKIVNHVCLTNAVHYLIRIPFSVAYGVSARYFSLVHGWPISNTMESSTNDDRADLASSSRPTKTHRAPRLSLDHNSSEKTPTTDDQNSIPPDSSCSTAQPTPQWSPYLDSATCTHSYPARTSQFLRHAPNRRSISLSSGRRRSSVLSALQAWSPVIMYGTTTLAFVVMIAFYKTELFQCLSSGLRPFFPRVSIVIL